MKYKNFLESVRFAGTLEWLGPNAGNISNPAAGPHFKRVRGSRVVSAGKLSFQGITCIAYMYQEYMLTMMYLQVVYTCCLYGICMYVVFSVYRDTHAAIAEYDDACMKF